MSTYKEVFPDGFVVGNIEYAKSASKIMYNWIREASELKQEDIDKYFGVGYSIYDILRSYDSEEFIKIMEKYKEDKKQ